MSFGQKMLALMAEKGLTQADICKATGFKSGLISQIARDPERDPRLSTAAAISDVLGVSLDFMAGRTENPLGFCEEEMEDVYVDSESLSMLRDISKLGQAGRASVREMIDLQLFKSEAGGSDTVSGAQVA